MNSISCRKPNAPVIGVDPVPPLNYVVQENSKGERKLIPQDPVAPSRASDFNVVNNAIYRGLGHGISYRMNIDPVDVDSKLSKLI